MMRVWLWVVLVACANKPSEPPRAPDARAADVRAADVRAAQAARADAPPKPPVPRGPVQTTPYELFCDFTRPDADGLALLDKYAGGATFTATIKTVGVEEDGAPVVWVDVDGENMISLEFAAPPPHALQPGARLTVTCKIGGASGALMMVTSCTPS